MTLSDAKLTPSEELAARIVKKLKEDGLLENNQDQIVQKKIAEGKMTSEDWKLTFEKSLGLHKKGE